MVNWTGTAGNDVYNGTPEDDSIYGLGGDDTLRGGDGNDYMDGGDGIDFVDGGNGTGFVNGGTGNDTVHGARGGGFVNGGDGNDIVYAYGSGFANGDAGDDTIYGSANGDNIDGGTGADRMVGGEGGDRYEIDNVGDVVVETASTAGTDSVNVTVSYNFSSIHIEHITIATDAAITITANGLGNHIFGGAGANRISGLGGDDHIYAGGGADIVDGGDGNDNIYGEFSGGVAGNDRLYGRAGNDYLYGDGGNDALDGGEGNDRLDGGVGADTMSGGAGDDYYTVDNAGDTVIETASSGGEDSVNASISFDARNLHIENITLTGSAAINAFGNALDNRIDGGSGTNTIYGYGGDDDIFGGNGGNDLIDGGAGNDSIYGQGSGSLRLYGQSGDDYLFGGSGNDLLDGGSGEDYLSGGVGNDRYIVADKDDWVTEDANAGSDTVEARISWTLSGNIERLALKGTSNLNGFGNALNNRLIGNLGNNTLNGGAGADTMSGGAGNDTYYVDNVGDKVIEAASSGTDSLYASVTYSVAGVHIENLTLTGSSHINATGNGLANTLNGNTGNNTLYAGAGNDTLIGGAGADKLYGGSGADTFLFLSYKQSDMAARDVIYDFSRAEADKIDVSAIDARTTVSGNQAFTFIGTAEFGKKAGELRYLKKDGDTFIHADLNGDGDIDFSVRLDAAIDMRSTDFIL